MSKLKEFKIYNSKGIVFGNCWGGGKCGYRATEYSAETENALINKIEISLKDGSLDSGMGFESLYDATL